jgi:Plexin repeat
MGSSGQIAFSDRDQLIIDYVNATIAELDANDGDEFRRCWGLNSCGACIESRDGKGCGWCPYVRFPRLAFKSNRRFHLRFARAWRASVGASTTISFMTSDKTLHVNNRLM